MHDALFSLFFMTLLLFGSPGPAPISLLASGANFGYRRNLPFLTGILIGLSLAMVLVNVGLAQLIETSPQFASGLSILCVGYLVYLAYKLYVQDTHNRSNDKLPGFTQGVLLNLINPKAYASLITLFSQFSIGSAPLFNPLLFTGLICISLVAIIDALWLLAGAKLGKVFRSRQHIKRLNGVCSLAILLVASVLISH
ncbi:LysE family translocator [Pseudoalteromonas sp. JBTF-M23]|uniref:LysE family translocator n=1 Tax=Pseudoalteromonas caenipelagi TaxID=2726988 RepID=A0A849VG03_9GAMM|nr:LysE family translocator [Pseudoalteromonas caenipelagi]NOU52206.1 LysE family translocator [Pseudoalteromonas caenipelagi]